MGWLGLYLDDGHNSLDPTVKELASMQNCSRAHVWLCMHSDRVSNAEMLDRIVQGANIFHQEAGFCFVYHPSKCKQEIALIEEAIRISLQDIALPRQMHDLQLSFGATDDEEMDGKKHYCDHLIL